MKLSILFFCLVFIFMCTGCSSNEASQETTVLPETQAQTEAALSEQTPPTFQFDPANVDALYDRGYGSIEELMTDAVLIVRATPVSIETESDFAVCYVLDVAESSIEGIDTIHLRQMKDQYCLSLGKEAVLVLAEDVGEGYYHVLGGGSGLFRYSADSQTLSGMLLEDLLESTPATLRSEEPLTLENVYDLLITHE